MFAISPTETLPVTLVTCALIGDPSWICDECACVLQILPYYEADRFIYVRQHVDWHEKSRQNWHPFYGGGVSEFCSMCGREEAGHDDQFKYPQWKERQDAVWSKK